MHVRHPNMSKQLDIEYWGGLGWGYRCVLRAHYI